VEVELNVVTIRQVAQGNALNIFSFVAVLLLSYEGNMVREGAQGGEG
jgi:hypothetical protein